MVDGSVIKLNAHFSAPSFHFLGYEICAIISDDAVGDTVSVYGPGYEVYYWSRFGRFDWFGFYPFGELVHSGSPGLGGVRIAELSSSAGLQDYKDKRLKTSSRVRMGVSLAWKASLAIRICRSPTIVTDSV